MRKNFFETLQDVFPSAFGNMVGYAPVELEKIQKLYGIKISGELESFLLRAGRSDGGAIGDDPIILYRNSWSVRTQLLFQVNFFNSLQEIGAWDFINKPFVFSVELESQYFYLMTESTDPNRVYNYNEIQGTVTDTGKSLNEYLIDLLDKYPLGGPICIGELLNI